MMRSIVCFVIVTFSAAVAAGCSRPLPEEGTPSATLYAQKCGACHPAYAPSLLTAKMWNAMVARMEIEMRRSGRSLSDDDKREILAYLARNADGH